MPKVDYTRETFNKCLCGGCPVQLKSPCIIGKEELLAPKKDALQNEGKMPDPKEMPGIYCTEAVGKSECEDLNKEKNCLCPACPVAIIENINNNYYCTKGSADEIG